MNKEIMIGNHKISEDSPTFVIAEMSANHLMDFDRAVAIMQAAKRCLLKTSTMIFTTCSARAAQ